MIQVDQDKLKIIKENKLRLERNSLLQDTDKYMLEDFPIDSDLKQAYREYREYLRYFTSSENWYNKEILKFEEWNNG